MMLLMLLMVMKWWLGSLFPKDSLKAMWNCIIIREHWNFGNSIHIQSFFFFTKSIDYGPTSPKTTPFSFCIWSTFHIRFWDEEAPWWDRCNCQWTKKKKKAFEFCETTSGFVHLIDLHRSWDYILHHCSKSEAVITGLHNVHFPYLRTID